MRTVSKLRRITAALVLAIWALATWHCSLEGVPGLGFLACCQHPDTAPHQDKDCEQDSCSVVESGFYKCEDSSTALPVPYWLHIFTLPAPELPVLHREAGLLTISSAPPELPQGWRFTFRAALPARAPSFV